MDLGFDVFVFIFLIIMLDDRFCALFAVGLCRLSALFYCVSYLLYISAGFVSMGIGAFIALIMLWFFLVDHTWVIFFRIIFELDLEK